MRKIIFFVAGLAMSSYSFAALYARDLDGDFSNGHEAVYDDVLNITWLADANLPKTETFGIEGYDSINGVINWDVANSWLAAMNSSNEGKGYFGINTWRLPKLTPVNGVSLNTQFTYDGSSDNSYQLSAPIDPIYNPSGQSPGSTASELAYHYHNNFGAIAECSGIGSVNTYGCVSAFNVFGLKNAADPNNYKSLFTNILEDSVYWSGTELSAGSPHAFMYDEFSGWQHDVPKWWGAYIWAVADGDIAVVPLPAAAWFFLSAVGGLIGFKRRFS